MSTSSDMPAPVDGGLVMNSKNFLMFALGIVLSIGSVKSKDTDVQDALQDVAVAATPDTNAQLQALLNDPKALQALLAAAKAQGLVSVNASAASPDNSNMLITLIKMNEMRVMENLINAQIKKDEADAKKQEDEAKKKKPKSFYDKFYDIATTKLSDWGPQALFYVMAYIAFERALNSHLAAAFVEGRVIALEAVAANMFGALVNGGINAVGNAGRGIQAWVIGY